MSSTTWNEASKEAVVAIFSLARKNPTVSVVDLRQKLDSFTSSLFDRPGGKGAATAHFINIGADAVELAAASGNELSIKLVSRTLVKKQRDYGSENISRFGRKGILVRLHDKVARLENLLDRGTAPENESIADTYLDIVGYCAIGIMWEASTFLLPLE